MRLRLFVGLLSLLALTAIASAQGQCDAEVKVLLDPSEARAAVKAFHAGPPTEGQIYLFDTKKRELFARGVIVRARRTGAVADLMVKVRVPADEEMAVSGLGRGFKCEVDRTGTSVVRSYSVKTKFKRDLPVDGEQVLKLLNAGQKRLLEEFRVAPDWSRVERVASIDSTAWDIRNESGLSKLSLELWQWPRNQVLELSTKIASDDASMSAQLQSIVRSKGLSLQKTQTQKTRLAVENVE